MHKICKSTVHSIGWLLATLCLSTPLDARPHVQAEDSLYAKDKHRIAANLILEALNRYHYRDVHVDDRLSSKTLNNYLDMLDGNRMFFLGTDVADFSTRYRFQLDDHLSKGQLQPAFDIFLVYRHRVQERIAYALLLLNQEYDFSTNEQYRFDRDGLPWAGSLVELNEVWRKRVKNDLLSLKLAGKESADAVDTLQRRYRAIESSALQMNSDDIFQLFINAFTTTIEPHTAYLSPRSSENFDISMQLSLEGIGAVLRSASGEYTIIQRLVPGGPADLSGELKAEDRIVGVGQGKDGEIIDVIGWRLDDVVDLIRGPRNTLVRLQILPEELGINGATRVVEIVRDRIKLEQRAAFSYVINNETTDSRIGVISIPSFYVDFNAQARGQKDYRSTTRDVHRILEELQADGISGLVVDLRGNGGGSLHEALSLTGLFIDSGPIVQTRDANGRIEINTDPYPGAVYPGPLSVLVDRYSASASEIFSGAIQDYRRGLIIGEITFGKGTVQNIIDLNRFHRTSDDLGKLKTTIAQFFRVNGGSNQYHGVEPDLIFPTAPEDLEYGERTYDNSLPWSAVEPLDYRRADGTYDYYAEAIRNYRRRIAADREIVQLVEDARFQRRQANRQSISLMESARRQQQTELETIQDRERREIVDPRARWRETGENTVSLTEVDLMLQEAVRILDDYVALTGRLSSGLQPQNPAKPLSKDANTAAQ